MSGLFNGNVAVQEQSRILFRHIFACQPVTRPMVLSQLNLAPTSLTRALDRLLDAGIIEVAGQADSTGGRPASRFQIRRDARGMIGISVSGEPGRPVRLVLLDLALEPVDRRALSLAPAAAATARSLAAPADATAGSADAAAANADAMCAAGMNGPAAADAGAGALSIDDADGSWAEAIVSAAGELAGDGSRPLLGIGIDGAENLPGLGSDDAWRLLQARLAERFGCPVCRGDGLSGAGYLLARKAKADAESMALLSLDEPITLVQGVRTPVSAPASGRLAPAVAAFPVMDALDGDEPVLRPLQAIISQDAIGRRFAALRDQDALGFADFCQACQLDKKKARRLLDSTAQALAQAIMGIACVAGLTEIVVSGAVMAAVPSLLPAVMEKVARLGQSLGRPVRLGQQPFGDDLRAAGAAAMMLARAIETPVPEQPQDAGRDAG